MPLGTIFHFPLFFVFISMVLIIIGMVVMMFPVERFFRKEGTQKLCEIIFWILLFFLVAYVVSVIPYFFGENKTVDNTASIISSIADIAVAAITALLFCMAYRTLVEMKNQRNMANTPRLHVTSPSNRISIESTLTIGVQKKLPVEWKGRKIAYEEAGKNIISEPYLNLVSPINIVNTGSSPALDVEIKWRLEDEYIKAQSEKFNALNLGIRCELMEHKDIFVMHVADGSFNFVTKRNGTVRNCILPYSNKDDDIIKMKIPKLLYIFKFMELCVLYAQPDSDSYVERREINLSPLIADISYFDNINSPHKGELYVNLRVEVSNNENNREGILFKKGTLIDEYNVKYIT